MKTQLIPPIDLIVIDAVLECNFRCSYCYADDQMQQHKARPLLTIKHLHNLFLQIAELKRYGYVSRLAFVWPGGEPLLAGIDFFRNVVSLQKKIFPHENIYNQINTNASLLSYKWVSFLNNEKFDVIIGLDGPQIFNSNRRTKMGIAAYDEIIRGIKLLKSSGTPLKYISVITEKSYKSANYLYDFALTLHPETVDYIPCFDATNIPDIANDHYAQFMISMFNLWYDDDSLGRPKRITTLSSILEAITHGDTSCCTLCRNCGGRIYMNASGTLRYCCNGYFKSEFTYLGHIDSINLINQHTNTDSQLSRIRQHVLKLQEACSACPAFCICGGGCTTQRPATSGNPVGMTHYCNARYSIIKHILHNLKERGVVPFFQNLYDIEEFPESPPEIKSPFFEIKGITKQ